MLATGIIGLPNVGKSTLFNALTAGHAAVSNYPFTTIDSNIGMAEVPDQRLESLRRVLEPRECTPCAVEFVDIAGLVEGASRGEGLGNQFLGAIRSVDALVHVLRCFGASEVAHVVDTPDPARDVGLVETELLLADLQVLEGVVARKRKEWKANPRGFVKEEERLDRYQRSLAEGTPLRAFDLDRDERRELKAIGMLTGKPVLYVANVSEEDYGAAEPPIVGELRQRWAEAGSAEPAVVVPISAKIEWELRQLAPDERAEFMTELGLNSTGLDRLVEAVFAHLHLIRFYTLANEKLRAWEVEAGTLAPQAAGQVHSDMERGFIRAHVAQADEVIEHGSLQELHHLGRLRTEGKNYEVRDGDVLEFFFSN